MKTCKDLNMDGLYYQFNTAGEFLPYTQILSWVQDPLEFQQNKVNMKVRKIKYNFNNPIIPLSWYKKYSRNAPTTCFPPGLEVLQIDYDYYSPLPRLPNTLKKLEFMRSYQQPLNENISLSCLETLYLWKFNHKIDTDVLPDTLKYLHLLDYTHRFYDGTFPSGLLKLNVGYNFNHPISVGILPSSLKKLNLGEKFNQPLMQGVLPSGLEELEFSECSEFNQPLQKGVLPSTLRLLYLGKEFNQPIQESLPSNIEHLHFGKKFDQPINSLPSALIILSFGESFMHPLQEHVLPPTLQRICVDEKYDIKSIKKFKVGNWMKHSGRVYLIPK